MLVSMTFFIQLIVIAIVLGLLYWLVLQLPLPEPFKTIVKVLVILAVIFWLLSVSGLWPGARLRIGALQSPGHVSGVHGIMMHMALSWNQQQPQIIFPRNSSGTRSSLANGPIG